ncbi:kip1 ubiquitination-promoting complex subunit 1 [Brevipalpus obovatus]|uniref:kip1 ubiquitination-promoting complex subunit 1 n=1 Tax=Brevipalpus obovatus TaxID=246614 RepID=UPI003D9F8503
MDIWNHRLYYGRSDFQSSFISLEELDSFIDRKMKDLDDVFEAEEIANRGYKIMPECNICGNNNRELHWSSAGRIGGLRVSFDLTTSIGQLNPWGCDNLTLLSRSGFSSVKANVAVFSGKWMYEVMLITKGVMQVGWATLKCDFSPEQGVGDTRDSYAYDGNRVRKWNLTTSKYGDTWNCGDVVGCAIDLDNGSIDFFRNGKHMGRAFNHVRLGPGLAYFPAVSLAYGESLTANFGATPLRYPVKGYQPLEAVPLLNIRKANLMLDWLFTLAPFRISTDSMHPGSNRAYSLGTPPPSSSSCVQSYLIANIILKRLSSFLANRYINEFCLLRKLLACNDCQLIRGLLDIFWALMEGPQIEQCVQHLVVALVNACLFSRFDREMVQTQTDQTSSLHIVSSETDHLHDHSHASPSLPSQKQYLLVALSLFQHPLTRNHLLENVLFDKLRFFHLFTDQTALDDEFLEKKIFSSLSIQNLLSPEAHKILRSEELENSSAELESLHQMILDTLIFQDGLCRNVFIKKFDRLLKDMNNPLNLFRHPSPSGISSNDPVPATLGVFHRLTSLIRVQYENIISSIPISFFTDPACVSTDVCRTGGLMTHLIKSYEKEVSKLMETNAIENPLMKHVYILINGLICLYTYGAHKQLGKYCAVRENLFELADALEELKSIPFEDEEAGNVIKNSIKILEKDLLIRARQLALVNSTILTTSKRADIYWLLKILLNTLDQASSCGYLFSFIPDYHIESCMNLCYAIRFYLGTSNNFPTDAVSSTLRKNLCSNASSSSYQRSEYRELLHHFCSFIASHFGDQRIVNADLRESVAQALASLVSNQESLRILETIPQPSRLKMLKSLTAPYENRAWGQSNWILLRMWKGDGFAFRYTSLSNVTCKLINPQTSKELLFSNLSYLPPCPSPQMQRELGEYLSSDPEASNVFISSLLCQLNWSFSEFIGMLQEIQNAGNRPEKIFVDPRQLKICCTCFDLTLALLRVLEMITTINHELVVSPPGNDLILSQTCTALNQILNRITVPTGCFEYIIDLDMVGLEMVTYFPILSAVGGLLVALVLKGKPEHNVNAIKSLISDANFLQSSYQFMIGQNEPGSGRYFHFKDFVEVSPEEFDQISRVVDILVTQHQNNEMSKSIEQVEDDDLCTICYASKKIAQFVPCGHQSCKSCIATHFMRHQECFFCKTILEKVILSDSGQVIFPESMSDRSAC